MKNKTFGAEIEKPIASSINQTSHWVSQEFFKKLALQSKKRKVKYQFHNSDLQSEVILGVGSDDIVEQGIDHGFNILETSSRVCNSLSELEKVLKQDLQQTQELLKKENATIINSSIHPLIKTDLESYQKYAAPKGVYPYLFARGWDFLASIDAKSQNSPSTGVDVYRAADALSVILGAGAAFIALFANSPFAEGKFSGYKESRVLMWERVMKFSKSEGDRKVVRFPKHRFETLAQYFNWMFGKGTNIVFVLDTQVENRNDYKGIGDRLLIVDKNPSVLEFLSQTSWDAYYFTDLFKGFPFNRLVKVKPKINDLEVLQFAQFIGARIRFKLKNHSKFPVKDFLNACNQPEKKKIEDIFSKFAEFTYIEGRDPGANFPDKETREAGEEIAESVMISPSAIQAGLINNLDKALGYILKYKWEDLGLLRDAAIKKGLEGKVGNISVKKFTKELLEIAAAGLAKNEQRMLNFPRWILKTNKNNADRAIDFVNGQTKTKSVEEALKELI